MGHTGSAFWRRKPVYQVKSQPTLYQTLSMASPASQHPKKSTWPGKTQRHNRESRVGNSRRGKVQRKNRLPRRVWLIAGVLHGAIDVRVHSRVIEGAGQDRHGGRSCPAAVDGSFVIATLPGGEAADDQPDDEDHRSDVHLDLLSIIRVNMNRRPIAMRTLPFPESGGKHTRTWRYQVRRERIPCIFQKSGSRAGHGDRHCGASSEWTPGAIADPSGNFQISGSCRRFVD